MSKKIVITPVIDASGKNHFNLLINKEKNQQQITPVIYANSDRYVIIHDDDARPNIVIDDETLNILMEARYRINIIKDVIKYFKKNQNISDEILNDTNLLAKITTLISREIITDEYLEELCMSIPETKKYIIKE